MAANPGGTEPVMSKADLKAMLNLSKRQPVSCAIGMTKDKQGVILLHRLTKPRKLLAELKRQAAASGLELDNATLRFGRANVDGASDSTTVHFTINKDAPAAMRMKLVEQLRPAGFQKCDLSVDGALENETEADAAPDASGQAAAPGAARPATSDPAPQSAAQTGATAPSLGRSPSNEVASGPDIQSSETPPPAPSTAPRQPGNAAPITGAAPADVAELDGGDAAPRDPATAAQPLRTRLTGLVKQVLAAMPSNPANAAELRATATTARQALTAGDLGAASTAADALEHLLGGPAQAANANPGTSTSAAPNPDTPPTSQRSAPAPTTPQAVGPDTAPPASGAARTAAQPRHQPGSPVFAKGRDTWTAVRAKLSKDLDDALKALTAGANGDASLVQGVEQLIKPIMAELDDTLTHKLDEIAKGGDATAHAHQVQEAEAILNRYKTFATGNAAVAHLDKNPAHPVALARTLTTALAALEKVVQTSDGASQQARAA